MRKLAGVIDPETKRKIIGNEFIEVFDAEAHRILKEEGEVEWLVQGTLIPTSSSRARCAGRRRSSSRITTWVGCPRP